MSDEIKQWQEKLHATYSHPKQMLDFITNTLEQFAYRYLETTISTNIKPIHNDSKFIIVESYESNLKEVLKNKNPKILSGIKSLALKFSPKENPTIRNQIKITINKLTVDQGDLHLQSTINWDYPHFQSGQENEISQTIHFTYQELAEFRKKFPLHLETICELF
jgi:hypothetical protein